MGKSYYDKDASASADSGREEKEPMTSDSNPPGAKEKGESSPFCERIHPGNVCLDEKAVERVYKARVQAAIEFKAARAEKKKREAFKNHHFDIYNTSTSTLPPIISISPPYLSSTLTPNTPSSSVPPIQ